MNAPSNVLVAALVALSQLLHWSVDAFTANSILFDARALSPSQLYFKNELLSDVTHEILVSDTGKKKCCKGCSGCPFGDNPRDSGPTVLKESGDATDRPTMKTNYRDTAAGKGLPLI
mmetsp:Transcript_3087/g.7845  ORF Transcript_3087/g.7845 Transcript_3087/m.7845 type:complete len:117 (-) Transcript_3087:177-527(-)|eukprot:CAMPEP_0181118716 /NCGR_PEP_ID=MMETSP1071-20121207/23229_1 /TAXON_ID=35127 /ORGANISM="Thalassiosira sp., Strain NH16" /LENGTH=116 /DNA_ID=CAMNT_0023203239 /DNA_START=421 /DNA_END=771 /DNA_ORIENTATION=+